MVIDTKRRREMPASAEVTVSSKRQITIPAAMAKELGLEPGDKLIVRLQDGSLALHRRPSSLVEYLDSFPQGTYGRTKEEIDAYIRDGRRGWDRRAQIAEGEAYVPSDDPRFDP